MQWRWNDDLVIQNDQVDTQNIHTPPEYCIHYHVGGHKQTFASRA